MPRLREERSVVPIIGRGRLTKIDGANLLKRSLSHCPLPQGLFSFCAILEYTPTR
jgi:hypothetical protein